jgi:hypothetical protein
MSPTRFLTCCFVIAAIAVGAVGVINIMKLRMEADVIGQRIQRIERAMAESKKELDTLKRQRDQSVDTVQLQARVGDSLKPPVPEQVVWIRVFSAPPPAASSSFIASPRMSAREIAFRPPTGQGGRGDR